MYKMKRRGPIRNYVSSVSFTTEILFERTPIFRRFACRFHNHARTCATDSEIKSVCKNTARLSRCAPFVSFSSSRLRKRRILRPRNPPTWAELGPRCPTPACKAEFRSLQSEVWHCRLHTVEVCTLSCSAADFVARPSGPTEGRSYFLIARSVRPVDSSALLDS